MALLQVRSLTLGNHLLRSAPIAEQNASLVLAPTMTTLGLPFIVIAQAGAKGIFVLEGLGRKDLIPIAAAGGAGGLVCAVPALIVGSVRKVNQGVIAKVAAGVGAAATIYFQCQTYPEPEAGIPFMIITGVALLIYSCVAGKSPNA